MLDVRTADLDIDRALFDRDEVVEETALRVLRSDVPAEYKDLAREVLAKLYGFTTAPAGTKDGDDR